MTFYSIAYQDIVEINLWCQQIVADDVKPTYGIRDYNLLKSIPESINQSFAGEELYPTVCDKCTHLWFSLSQFHCFADGNKRTALVTAVVYLILNGFSLKENVDDLYDTCIKLASSKLEREEVGKYIKKNTMRNIELIDSCKCITDILNLLSQNCEFITVLEKLGQ